jgi:hypothetical protein
MIRRVFADHLVYDVDKTISELASGKMYWDAECGDMADDSDVLSVLLRCYLHQLCRNCSFLEHVTEISKCTLEAKAVAVRCVHSPRIPS